MLDTKKHAYDLLRNNAALVSALGSASKIQYFYPNDFNALPIITYSETNNQNVKWFDNMPWADESTIEIHVWANVSTTALCKLVDSIMAAGLYTRDFSSDVPEPDVKIFHRVMRYRRSFTADDLD
jgi:hypothetical protein